MYVIYEFYILQLDRNHDVSLYKCLATYRLSQNGCIGILSLSGAMYRILSHIVSYSAISTPTSDCERKSEYLVGTNTDTGRTCRLHTERFYPSQVLNPGLSCCWATALTTTPPCCPQNKFMYFNFLEYNIIL